MRIPGDEHRDPHRGSRRTESGSVVQTAPEPSAGAGERHVHRRRCREIADGVDVRIFAIEKLGPYVEGSPR